MYLTEKEKQKIEEEEKYRHAVVASITRKKHLTSQKHGVPLFLSVFIPGLGQIVKGEVKKGVIILLVPAITFMIILAIGIATGNTNGGDNNGAFIFSFFGYSWLGYTVLYIWQLIDAYNN